jgi:acetyltransferase-like isoleucine patch superfamily enzyme
MINTRYETAAEPKWRRGRETFTRLKPFFHLCVLVMRIFPASFCKYVLRSLRYVKGKFGFGLRYILTKRLAQSCGDNVAVYEAVFLLNIQNICFGNHITVHPFSYLDAEGGISIGNDVSIAHNVSIISFEHDYRDLETPINSTPLLLKKVVIEDNVWVGAGVRILGGVTIGTGSAIGAGAVVTRNIPPMSIAVGVPARVIKSRTTLRNLP